MIDELFLFLDPGAVPEKDRLIGPVAAPRSAFVWVPDAASAAAAAAAAAAEGVRLIELYRGLDVVDAGQVVGSVGVTSSGAAGVPVGLSTAYLTGAKKSGWSAVVYDSESAPAAGQHHTQHHAGRRTDIVWAPGEHAIVDLVVDLALQGVELVEICGGTPLTTVAAVQRALRATSLVLSVGGARSVALRVARRRLRLQGVLRPRPGTRGSMNRTASICLHVRDTGRACQNAAHTQRISRTGRSR